MLAIWNIPTLFLRILTDLVECFGQYKKSLFLPGFAPLRLSFYWLIMTLKYKGSMVSSSAKIGVINRINRSNPAHFEDSYKTYNAFN